MLPLDPPLLEGGSMHHVRQPGVPVVGNAVGEVVLRYISRSGRTRDPNIFPLLQCIPHQLFLPKRSNSRNCERIQRREAP